MVVFLDSKLEDKRFSVYLGGRLRSGDDDAPSSHPAYCHLWPVQLYHSFLTLSHKRYDFRKRKNVIEHKMYVLNFTTIFV